MVPAGFRALTAAASLGVRVKKSLSNRDVERIALNANLSTEQVRAALAMRNDVVEELHARVADSAQQLNYSITLRDRVAMAAGTSIATVNRAYRPDARHLVRPEVLRAIEREAARLGYQPDPVAQSRRSSQGSVVAICPDIRHLASAYHMSLIRNLSEAVSARGLTPVIAPIPAEWQLPDIAQSSVTGLVILWEGPRTNQQVAALRAANREAVLIGYHEQLPSVAPDWVEAYEQLTHRALAQSYTRLHLGYFAENCWPAGARLEGVARALSGHRCPEIRLWISPTLDVQQTAQQLHRRGLPGAAQLLTHLHTTRDALERRPPLEQREVVQELYQTLIGSGPHVRVALLGHSDAVLRALMALCAQSPHPLRIGQNVGLAGHDNLDLLGEPGQRLTTIDYSLPAMADQVLSYSGSFRRVQAQVIIGESL